MMRLPQHGSLADARLLRMFVMVLWSAVLFAGCSALPQIGKRDAETVPEVPQGELVYFVAEDGLNVYAEPSAKARLIDELPLHARVLRTEVQRGYAHVRTEDGGVEGWVDNARLIWRLPQDESPVQPVATEPGSSGEVPSAEREIGAAEADSAPQAVPQAPQESTARTSPEPAVGQPETPASTQPPAETEERPEPSVFNPF